MTDRYSPAQNLIAPEAIASLLQSDTTAKRKDKKLFLSPNVVLKVSKDSKCMRLLFLNPNGTPHKSFPIAWMLNGRWYGLYNWSYFIANISPSIFHQHDWNKIINRLIKDHIRLFPMLPAAFNGKKLEKHLKYNAEFDWATFCSTAKDTLKRFKKIIEDTSQPNYEDHSIDYDTLNLLISDLAHTPINK